MTFTTGPHGDIEAPWVGDVIRFWFEELSAADWFTRSEAIDARIRARFLPLLEELAMQEDPEASTPRPVLAHVIVLDQYSRNLFRGSPRAYAADAIARRLARSAISKGLDAALPAGQRLFLYLPFEHSEDREDQAYSLSLFRQLGRDDWTQPALEHKAIIDRFGRFPHRNAVLGRASTAEELAFLEDPRNSF